MKPRKSKKIATASKKKIVRTLSQLSVIVDNSRDAIISETLDGVITSWNKGAEKMFGYSAKEIVGKKSTFLLPPEIQIQMILLFKKIKRGEAVEDYESAILHKNGSRVYVSISIAPIHSKSGEVIGASVVERDITDRKKAEQKIKELNQIRNKFISIISHQLRTPLTSINWNLEVLLQGNLGNLTDTQREFLQATYEASVGINLRISRLLTAMDIQEGRLTYEVEEVVLDSLCWEVTHQLSRRCRAKGIACTYTSPERPLPNIESDGSKIRTIIHSLMENAIVYTKRGGMIASALKKSGKFLRFEVKDTGIGIPAAEQHRVFTRFFRGSNAATMYPDGFGLGLYIAKHFVDQLGGKIGFESREGQGSAFWFELPLSA